MVGAYGTWIIFWQLFSVPSNLWNNGSQHSRYVVLPFRRITVDMGMGWYGNESDPPLAIFWGKNLFNGVWFYLILSCLVLTARIQERATASIAMCVFDGCPEDFSWHVSSFPCHFFNIFSSEKGHKLGIPGIPYTSPQPWTVDKASFSGANKFNTELLQADRSRSKLNVGRTHTILPTHRSTRPPHLFNRTLAHCAGAIFWVENPVVWDQGMSNNSRCDQMCIYSAYIFMRYSTHIYRLVDLFFMFAGPMFCSIGIVSYSIYIININGRCSELCAALLPQVLKWVWALWLFPLGKSHEASKKDGESPCAGAQSTHPPQSTHINSKYSHRIS